MSDREFSSDMFGFTLANDDLSLPKDHHRNPPPSMGQTFSKDARDLLMECCVEFITLISSEANDISEKEAKKTIACEHVEKALRDLGFADYIPDVLAVAEEHREQLKSREKKQSKMEQSGLSEEELLRQQQELFRSATEKYNAGPE
ncbi:negative cofactor 2 complex subunit beta [Penicillium cataractarum]|uniref:NCT transcriptional regulatory complex subunit B n=1 Tax=Penicillium cataractarum TaxID=2100454 RepID=A0A9W9SG11_9EURO|nr:negative cofactor 2 complex subunit beta [Penicillium cataractarum]KAJ5377976.1 negative cofactor 2 complex subunit beta [Penicillium cataractarum]